MPRLNETGPEEKGSKTGRAPGKCSAKTRNSAIKKNDTSSTRGLGFGIGRGRGVGRRQKRNINS